MKESQASDKTGKGVIPLALTSTGAGSTLSAANQPSPSAVFAPCRSSNGRRWVAAWACAFVAHGGGLFLLWGLHWQVRESPPSGRAIVLRLLPSPSLQASAPADAVPSAAAQEPHSLTLMLHGSEKGQEQKKRASAEPKPRASATSAVPSAGAAARPKSTAVSSSTLETLPLSEVPRSSTVESASLLESAENPPATNATVSITNREAASPVGALSREDGAPLPVAQVTAPPVVISRVAPSYPEHARALGIQGLVRLEAILSREGRIEQEITILQSIPMLDEAARTALKQWRFRPARNQSGQPVRVILEVPFRFTLKQ